MATLGQQTSAAQLEEAWQRVATLRPRLAPQVDTSLHSYRGEYWLVLSDRISGAHFRCAAEIEPFLTRLDGDHTVAEACAALSAGGGECDPLDILELLAQLQAAHLLLDLAPQDSGTLFEQRQKLARLRWLRRLASPLAIQVPLVDPDRVMARAAAFLAPAFRPSSFWCWLALVTLCLILAIDHRDALSLHWSTRFLDPGNLLMLWLLYPVVKGLHELGHGVATRVWGGEVHEMGVMLLVFTPVPYVDASASTAFPSRERRMVVAAAGIMVELLLASLALLAWLILDPGWLRDLCFNVMAIGGLSTLLFNGNPLLRFDGYYVLTDLIEMPNLRSRANAALGDLLKQRLLALEPSATAVGRGRERSWLLGYAVLSGVYRLVIGLTIALFVAGRFFFIGTALAALLLANLLVLPAIRASIGVWQQAQREGKRRRVAAVAGAASLSLVIFLFVIPLGNSTRADGIVQLPENTELRTRAAGFVEAVHKLDGDAVRAGELLLRLSNPELQAKEAELSARSEELAVRYNQALSGEPVELTILRQEITANAEALAEAREQLAHLTVASPVDGVFALPNGRDLPGRFIEKGDLLGHVLNQAAPTVRVVLPQDDVDRVRRQTRQIEVRLASRIDRVITAQRLRDVPMATSELPSALLGSREGGGIAVDARDQAGLRATRPFFQIEVTLPARSAGHYLGRRAHVRFEHFREPVGKVWMRAFRQKLLTALGI